MICAVWKTSSEWKPSKYDDCKISRQIFKGLDDGKSYYLNLNTKFPIQTQQWKQYLKEGNLIDVNIRPKSQNVDLFCRFEVKKLVK